MTVDILVVDIDTYPCFNPITNEEEVYYIDAMRRSALM